MRRWQSKTLVTDSQTGKDITPACTVADCLPACKDKAVIMRAAVLPERPDRGCRHPGWPSWQPGMAGSAHVLYSQDAILSAECAGRTVQALRTAYASTHDISAAAFNLQDILQDMLGYPIPGCWAESGGQHHCPLLVQAASAKWSPPT